MHPEALILGYYINFLFLDIDVGKRSLDILH